MTADMLTNGGGSAGTAAHAVAVYDSDDDLLRRVLPFLRAGLAAGQAVIAVVSERAAALLRNGLGADQHALQWQVPGVSYRSLGPTVYNLRRYLAERRAAGQQVRLVAENDTEATPARTAAYLRFEAASNDLLGDLGVTWACLYRRRRYPPDVLEQVAQVHPRLLDGDGRPIPSPRYRAPDAYLADHPGPLSPVPSDVVLDVPLTGPEQLASIRHTAVAAARRLGLPGDADEDFEVAAGEVMSNALRHGRPPRRVRLWVTDQHVVFRVDDGGSGDDIATKGFRPPDPATARHGGMGVWIARQLADVVHVDTGPQGAAVELQFPRLALVR